MPFQFEQLDIPDVILVTPKRFGDDRGFFMETYKDVDFKSHGITADFVQDNHSCSEKNVLRGIHFQKDPMAQGKLVRVAMGKVFDVVVDLRQGSPTFGRWVGRTLTAAGGEMLWAPPGFGHGVLTLEDNTHLLYKATAVYSPAHDRSIPWNDPDLNITWPLNGETPILSEKDQQAIPLKTIDNNFEYHKDIK